MKKRSAVQESRSGATAYSRARGGARYAKLAKSRAQKRVAKNIIKGLGITCASVLAVIAVLAVVFSVRYGINLFGGPSTNEPFYMLLMGIDKDEDRAKSSNYGPSDAAYRTDSLMLARIDPPEKQVTLISIHRDTKVDLGSHGTQKINAAYAFGASDAISKGLKGEAVSNAAADYTMDVVSKYAGVPIHYYAEMDFEGFTKIVDNLGGVEVNVPIDINDNLANAHLSKGVQTLNGTQALALSRARHAYDSYGPGDAYRSANQRMLISAILQKMLNSSLPTLLSSIDQLVSQDENGNRTIRTNLTIQALTDLAREMQDMDVENNIYTGQDPTTSQYINSLWYEVTDQAAWKKMMARVDAGLSPYESVEEDPTHIGGGDKVNIKNGDYDSLSGSDDSEQVTGTIEVLNATNSAGLAGKVSQSLKELGASSTKAGNANNKYTTSLIVYTDEANKSKAEAVAKALGGQIQVVNGNGQYSTTCDVLLILGSDMQDVD